MEKARLTTAPMASGSQKGQNGTECPVTGFRPVGACQPNFHAKCDSPMDRWTELATEWGIETGYYDVHGKYREADGELFATSSKR